MCFQYRSIVRDAEIEDCNPTVKSCELTRAKFRSAEHDNFTECRSVDASERRRRAQYPRVAAIVIVAAGVAALMAWAYVRRGRRRTSAKSGLASSG